MDLNGGNSFLTSDLYIIAPSYASGACVISGFAVAEQKIYKTVTLGKNFTLICDMGIDESNFASQCNYDHWQKIELVSQVTTGVKPLR